MLNSPVTKPILDRPSIAGIRQGIAAGVPKHMDVNGKAHRGFQPKRFTKRLRA